jgi:D-arabinonate dehydratase
MIIEDVRARTLRLPLERPIRTSDLVIEARELVLVDVELSTGQIGRGFGFTRDGPVARVVEGNLAPLVEGEDARLVEACWHRMYTGTRYLGRRGLLMRAISAVDIALWDAKAQLVGAPLWMLLGGARIEVPAYVAGGYYRAGEGPDEVEREFRSYRDAGYRGAKINVGGLSMEMDLERVAAARRGLGDRAELAVDFNGALRDARSALAWAQALGPYRIDQIEEPFLMDDAASWRGFAERSPIAVAMGEDESGRWAFADLVAHRAMDIVRHDATLVGGISEWTKIAGLALAHNLRLFPHWFPEIHVHLAAAFPSCLGVELVAPESGIMDVHRLMRNPVTAVDGDVVAPSAPGIGVEWNWEVIEACTL